MRYAPLAASAVVCAALLVGCGADPAPPAAALSVTSPATPAPKTAKQEAVADPERIRIPSIGVDARIVPVGLKPLPSREMVTPDPTFAGWFTSQRKPSDKTAFRPGEAGPAVIAAHVDSATGPDVFYRLKQLKKGAKVVVTDKAGIEHTFVVERSKQTAKTSLPAKKIWGATEGPALRLITCGGSFDKASGHYTANVTVFAKGVPEASRG